MDTLETTLGTLHVVVVGDAAGESGHSVGGWNAEMLKSERRSAPVSRRPLNRIALNYETTACASVRVYVQIFCHAAPYLSFSLFSYSREYIPLIYNTRSSPMYLSSYLFNTYLTDRQFHLLLSLSLELESFTCFSTRVPKFNSVRTVQLHKISTLAFSNFNI